MTAAALVPALIAWPLARDFRAGMLVLGVAIALLGWIRARHPQRETPPGLEAASRCLGVKAELEENEVFDTHSPLTVELWDRLLAYGAALGAASGAGRPLPMGIESDTRAWSASSGRWRSVRVRYPRLWPPGWGLQPMAAIAVGAAVAGGGGLVLYLLGPFAFDLGAGGIATALQLVLLALPSLAVVLGVALVVMAWRDLGSRVEVTGPILRLRSYGDKNPRYYLAVDDGESPTIRAWRVGALQYAALRQGQVVTVSSTPNLGCVDWIVDDAVPMAAE